MEEGEEGGEKGEEEGGEEASRALWPCLAMKSQMKMASPQLMTLRPS